MQIVIDIDKDVFERIKSGIPESVDCFKCEEAVLYGTPLPKNHGRLIDLDALCDEHLSGCYIELEEHEISEIPVIIEGTKGKGMTVAELIEKLKEVPQDLPVMAAGETAQKVIVEECEGNKYVRIFEPWDIELTGRFVEEGKE